MELDRLLIAFATATDVMTLYIVIVAWLDFHRHKRALENLVKEIRDEWFRPVRSSFPSSGPPKS